MQSIISIIVFLVTSTILGMITTHFTLLTDSKKGEDFNIKEYTYSFKKLRLNLKYIIIFFILFLVIVKRVELSSMVIYIPVLLGLILAFITDINYMIIPDTSSILIAISGIINLIFSFAKETLISSILGAFVGFGILFVINFIFYLITKTEGFGLGDMKLLGSIGLFVGIKGVIVVFVASIVISSITGAFFIAFNILKNKKRNKRKEEKDKLINTYLPFGPAIIISTIITLVIPPTIIVNFVDYIVTQIVNKMI